MIEAIVKNLEEFNKEQKFKSIAVLCKTPKEALKFSESLKEQKIENFYLVDEQVPKDVKVVVAPIYLVKGCQFDIVILASANNKNYNGSDFNNRLLYLAITRAAHRLYIHWYGKLATILNDPSLLSRKKQKKWSKPLKLDG